DLPAEKTAAVPTANSGGLRLTLNDGSHLDTGLLILAIGVKPETLLAAKAGLELGPRGGIKVDAGMRTSDPFIYAGGDAVEEIDFVTGESVLIPLAGPANRQGRIAADSMLGRSETYKKTQGTAICKLFDLAVASTGLNEKRLVQLGLPFEKVYVHPGSHAGYYPGAHPVSLKLLFA
ncbi:FAD/NAD(P)-binding oxidoreductase, partial [Aeromonas caviae]|uniref:NAD(P)/FAD-dependent oxidoreductase n=1 Tax=Aeromonas caviae TaxID=648 RepID=UPI0038D003B8